MPRITPGVRVDGITMDFVLEYTHPGGREGVKGRNRILQRPCAGAADAS